MVGFGWLQCRRVRPVLWDYASERLSEGPMEAVEQHLHGCAVCRHEVESLRAAQSFLSACRAEEEPAPSSDWNALRQRLLTQSPVHRTEPAAPRRLSRAMPAVLRGNGLERVPASWQLPLLTSLGGAFAALSLVAVGYGLFMHRQASPAIPSGIIANAAQRDYVKYPAKLPKAEVVAAPKPDTGNAAIIRQVVSIFNHTRVESAAAPSAPAKTVKSAPAGIVEAAAYKQNTASQPRLVARTRRPNAKSAARVFPKRADTRLAHSHESSLHFRHYTPSPDDRLPAAEQIASRYALEQVRPVSSDSEDSNNYIVGTVQPVAHDDDHDY